MHVPTIQVSRTQALFAYREYRDAVRLRHRQEDEVLKSAYWQIYRGQRVVDLVEAMRRAGLDHRARPRLAIARADAKMVFFRGRERGAGCFALDQWPNDRAWQRQVALPEATWPTDVQIIKDRITAMVPSIPPRHLPAGALARYHVLWEAEWQSAPRDPMLLRRLGRSLLFVVLATWDLTDIERAVLRDFAP